MSKRLSEEQIQEEIQRRVFEEEHKKQTLADAAASQEALSEVTSLSEEEIERIARTVRTDFAQQQGKWKRFLVGFLVADLIIVVLLGVVMMTKYNTMVSLDEFVKTQWSQVENVYQRRIDLVPNLVSTVKAYAAHEQELFRMITDARAKAGGMLSAEVLQDPASFQQFQDAQGQLSSGLRRMMALVEETPDIRGDQNFLALQAQLEGTENRIAVERKRFNEAVQQYNGYIKRFPQVMFAGLFHFQPKAYFTAQPQAENAPAVQFN